jgi:hypothetical protein
MRLFPPILALVPIGIYIVLAVVTDNGTERVFSICGAIAVLLMYSYFTWKQGHGPRNR